MDMDIFYSVELTSLAVIHILFLFNIFCSSFFYSHRHWFNSATVLLTIISCFFLLYLVITNKMDFYSTFASPILCATPYTKVLQFTLISTYILFCFYLFYFKAGELRAEISYFYSLMFVTGLFLCATKDLLWIFILLELLSLPGYTLVSAINTRYGYESTIRYLFYGSAASLVLLVVIAIVYVSNETVHFETWTVTRLVFRDIRPSSDVIMSFLIALAFFIKFGVGPFFVWVPDVYTSAKYPNFVFLSTVGKLALLAPVINLFDAFSFTINKALGVLLFFSALASAIILFQQITLRKIFAYSSIANYSLAFLGLVNGSKESVALTFVYCVYYTLISIITLSAFEFFKNYLNDEKNSAFKETTEVSDLKGLPIKGQLFFVSALIFSSGLPPIGLFYGKAILIGLFIETEAGSHARFMGYWAYAFLLVNIIALAGYMRLVSIASDFRLTGVDLTKLNKFEYYIATSRVIWDEWIVIILWCCVFGYSFGFALGRYIRWLLTGS